MNYEKSLEKAIIYIESHLGGPISVEDVARQTGYSYYHLTRQFSALLGESIGSYIKKRRLANAAKELIFTDKRILDIALDHGFESGEAFSRAFKAIYQVSPVVYRKNRLDTFISNKPKMDIIFLNHLAQNLTVHPCIVVLPDILTTGLRGKTSLKDNVIPDLWKQFWNLSGTLPHRVPQGRSFGICEACEEGNTLYTMNEKMIFSEVVSVEVSSYEGIADPFVSKTIRGGKYAVFTHTGSLAALPLSFRYIWGTWVLSTDEELDNRDDFELYDERFLGYDHPDSQIDLYIPIK